MQIYKCKTFVRNKHMICGLKPQQHQTVKSEKELNDAKSRNNMLKQQGHIMCEGKTSKQGTNDYSTNIMPPK